MVTHMDINNEFLLQGVEKLKLMNLESTAQQGTVVDADYQSVAAGGSLLKANFH